MSLYVRVEGVNLAHFVDDTQDLSTARGGSLMLRDVIADVGGWLRGLTAAGGTTPTVEDISTGASAGLFSLSWPPQASSPPTPAEIVTRIRAQLAGSPNYMHATLVVSATGSDDFAVAKETLLAANRWEQMQAPSVAVPSASASTPCDIDMVRPGDRTYHRPGSTHSAAQLAPVSSSVLSRREFGRSQKRGDFYSQEARNASGAAVDLRGCGFVNDLGELATRPEHRLSGKVAVIYVDGNGFGKIQQGCVTEAALRAWDDQLKSLRRRWLGALLERALSDRAGWLAGKDSRLETLLWGGDEFMLVVPAWKGWETLDFFYSEASKWQYQPSSGPAEWLTHAGGLLFCHHKAPIHRVVSLAKQLANGVKDRNTQEQLVRSDRQSNRFAYQVLESFDHVGRDLRSHQIEMLPRPKSLNASDRGEFSRLTDLCLHGIAAAGAVDAMDCVKAGFPRGQIYQVITDLRAGGDQADDVCRRKEARAKAARLLLDSVGHNTAHIDALRAAFGRNDTFWLHVAELWDYIGS